jgi:hypothetical protein
MKKLIAVSVIALCAAGLVFSQDLSLSISGEVKTGVFSYWTPENEDEGAFIHNSEDDNWMAIAKSGMSSLRGEEGLYRLNFLVEKGNIGAKFRFQTTGWRGGAGAASWGYAFLYGDFFEDQLKISAGKLGDSPWGTNERELLKEVDTTIGLRFEYMPSFLPGLDVGLVLNNWNTKPKDDAGLTDLLSETVLGLSYTHDYFHLRFAYRLDSEADEDDYYKSNPTDQAGRLVYRLEERIIQNYLPGFQIWSVGYFEELGSGKEDLLNGTSLVYVQYDPDDFTSQLRFGYNIVNLMLMGYEEGSLQYFSLRPSFYYKLFDNFLRVGAAFEFAKNLGGNKVVSDSYLYWYVEPEVRLNLGSGTYLALVYRYQDDYLRLARETGSTDDYAPVSSKTHWVNLRAVFTF